MSSSSALNSLLSSSTASSSSSIDLSSLLTAATGSTSSGIDVSAAVAAAIYAAQAPERQWQAQQATIKSQIVALTSVQSATSALSADLDDLNNLTGSLASRSVTSSSPSQLSGTAVAGAAAGTHLITVNSLATSASWYSPSVASASAGIGSSTFVITKSDGTQTSFALGTGGLTSLTGLASAINGDSLGITANVINDANGSRLALVGNSSGSAANFTVQDGAATASSWSSASLASASTPLLASSFQVSSGVTNATITVQAGETLAQVASSINNAGPTLKASVVTDATGSHLAIAGKTGNVTVSSDPALTMTQASKGANASLTVDGVPVSSSTNTVTGAIPGLTLNLLGATSGTQTTLTVAANSDQIQSTLSQFVTDYNSAISLVNSQFMYNSGTQTQGTLGGDSVVRSLQGMLLSVAGYQASSSGTSSGTTLATLGSLGINMNDDGTLSLDSSKLSQVVQSNPSGLETFFQGTALNGFAASVQKQLKTFSDTAIGSLASEIGNLNSQYSSLQTNVNDYESGYIASQRTVLTAMYSKAEIALQELPATMKQLQAQLGSGSGNA